MIRRRAWSFLIDAHVASMMSCWSHEYGVGLWIWHFVMWSSVFSSEITNDLTPEGGYSRHMLSKYPMVTRKGFTIYDHHCIQYPNYTKYKFELISYSACISQQGSYSHGKQGAESISLGFNIKMPSFQWRESYCGDKTKLRLFYLRNGISCTGNTPSVYRIRA